MKQIFSWGIAKKFQNFSGEIAGMILSNKEKNGKLCNTKSGRPAHVEDMSRAKRSRCALLGGSGGMPPPRKFLFSTWFSRLLSTFAAV